MNYRSLALPLAAFLLVLCPAPASQSQGSTPDAARAPAGAQSSETPSASPASASPCKEETADLHMARKEFREAADCYLQLTGKNPGNAAYYNKLGIAYHQLGMLGPAKNSYERALKVDPSFTDAMNNIGTVWYQRKKYGKAIKVYQKAIAKRPDMAVLYSNLGYAYFANKKTEEAIAAFRQALAIDPQFFEHSGTRTASMLQDRTVGDRGSFYFLLAKSFAQTGNVERCLHYLRKARDEGYTALAAVKTDPAFSALLENPELQELLAPRPAETVSP